MSRIKRMMERASLSMILAAALGFAATQSALAEYPEKPITIVIPFAAGSGNDTFGRLIAEGLQEKWGQPVIAENMPGGGGLLGAVEVARSAPDGYTLLTGSSSHPSGQAMRLNPPVDMRSDLVAIARYGFSSGALVVNPDLPVESVEELIEYSQDNPVSFGSSGVGSIIHLATEEFNAVSGLDAVHVPYGGGAPAILATIGNEVQFLLIDYGAAQSAINNGQVRLLATAGPERNRATPDTPTLRELGYDFEFNLSYGLFAPGGTPSDIVEKLNAAVNEIVDSERFRDYTENARSAAVDINDAPGAYQEMVVRELEQFKNVVDSLGLERQ